jgi:hypothetical protein
MTDFDFPFTVFECEITNFYLRVQRVSSGFILYASRSYCMRFRTLRFYGSTISDCLIRFKQHFSEDFNLSSCWQHWYDVSGIEYPEPDPSDIPF